jgi:DNA-binding transcriptional regulator LsrR (DeoR family)
MAFSTGRTVEHALRHLDPSGFARNIDLYSTVILLNAVGAFRDPSSVVDSAAALFGVGKSTSHVLRVCGLADAQVQPADELALRRVAAELLALALKADVIVGSVRPWDWFGADTEFSSVAQGRTQPFNTLFKGSDSRVNRAFAKANVVAVHQMIPLDADGRDVSGDLIDILGEPMAEIIRPTTESLAAAAASASQQVILAASHERKALSVLAILAGGLCNGLVADAELAHAVTALR